MRETPHDRDRMLELLAGQAAGTLTEAERVELLALNPDPSLVEEMELAAAAAHLATLGGLEAMPAGLRQELLERAPRSSGAGARRPGVFGWLGWAAAAAAIVVATIAWWGGPTPAPATRRERLLARAGDAVRMEWTAWGDLAEARSVRGDVVWSPSKQEGYMRFSGLKPNDPDREQYQLWIVDASRGEPLKVPPVDGGVFDAGAGGDVIVPIDPKLPVGKAFAFAVTIEPPGGVVVSDQSRKVVLAVAP